MTRGSQYSESPYGDTIGELRAWYGVLVYPLELPLTSHNNLNGIFQSPRRFVYICGDRANMNLKRGIQADFSQNRDRPGVYGRSTERNLLIAITGALFRRGGASREYPAFADVGGVIKENPRLLRKGESLDVTQYVEETSERAGIVGEVELDTT